MTTVLDLSEWRRFLRHPLSEAWGDMSEVEFEGLVADMKQHGYEMKQQVWLFEGRVLDGWHRLRAAALTNKAPTFENFKGSYEEAETFTIRRNLMRRHLDVSQRGLIAGRLANLKHGGNRKSDQVLNSTLETVAEQAKVGISTVRDGRKVSEKGANELQQAVMDKTISLHDAAAVADAPKAAQRKAVEAVREGKARTAKAAVARKPKQGRVVFDDRPIEQLIGKLTKSFDQRHNAHDKKHPKHHADCIDKMGLVLAAWKRWQKETT